MLLTLFMSSCHEEPTYPLLLVDADTLLMRGDYGKTDSLLTIFDNSYTKQEKAVLHYRQLLQIGRRFVEDELTADEKFCQLMDSKSFITRGEGNSSLSIKTQEFDMQFQQFLSQHDLTVDLTPTERKSLTLAENDWMTLIADEDAFLTYISENKTPQFQKYLIKLYQVISVQLP